MIYCPTDCAHLCKGWKHGVGNYFLCSAFNIIPIEHVEGTKYNLYHSFRKRRKPIRLETRNGLALKCINCLEENDE